jgi:hypothetical protein
LILYNGNNTIEFNANADGDWFFHIFLYHMMAGMNWYLAMKIGPNPNYYLIKEWLTKNCKRKTEFIYG